MRRDKKSFLVVGLGRFGSSLAVALTRAGHEVVGADLDMDTIDSLKSDVLEVLRLDGTNIHALAEVGVPEFDACVVASGEDLGQSLTIVMNLRELGARRIVAKAATAQHAVILEMLGVAQRDVVFPERDMGERMAHVLGSPLIADFVSLAADLSLVEVDAPRNMVGLSLIDLDLRRRHGVTVVGIRRNSQFIGSPRAEEVIEAADRLVLIGSAEHITRFVTR